MHLKKALPILILINASESMAWGERGHDLISQVAARQLETKYENVALSLPFISKEHMLGHVANLPDTFWRSEKVSAADRAINGPTHYIDLDLVYPEPVSLEKIERNFETFSRKAAQMGYDAAEDVGTAPWRVLQLQRLVSLSLTQAGQAENADQRTDAINNALLYAGIQSHFVGDLANPHHTTIDSDGRQTGQGGFHAYFETFVVNAIDFRLKDRVMQYASSTELDSLLGNNIPENISNQVLDDPSLLIFALTINSLSELDRLRQLDREHSLLQESNDGMRWAIRKPPQEVTGVYGDFIIERLAIGALVLSRLWYLAWNDAGRPNLSTYQSYHYWHTADFFLPDYLLPN